MRYFIYIVFFFSFVGCKSVKSTQELSSITKESEKIEVQNDSISRIETNGAIKDEVITSVPRSNTNNAVLDSLVDAKVDRILRMLNTRKNSGGNNYRLEFDELTREIRAYFELAETQNEFQATNSSKKKEISFEEQTDSYVKKKIRSIPFWIYIIAAIWFLPQIIEKLTFVSSPLVGIASKFKQK